MELSAYVMDSFGNALRLDYGSGHELHYFIFLMICLEEHRDLGGLIDPAGELDKALGLHVPKPPIIPEPVADSVYRRRQEFILFAFRDYIALMRRIQQHYNLEPAGSHGVWGLDDYHHLPYVFGAAQLTCYDQRRPAPAAVAAAAAAAGAGATTADSQDGDAEQREGLIHALQRRRRSSSFRVHNVFLPPDVCNAEKVASFNEEFFYTSMIQWIYTHKRGPFHEHSNMLYNISSVATWEKTFTGMMKMFSAEVIAKFNVSQHLLFGCHLPWNTRSSEEVPDEHQSILDKDARQ